MRKEHRMSAIIDRLEIERDKGFSFEGVNPSVVIEELLPHIGAPNPYLRDTLVYSALATLTTKKALTKEDYRKLLRIYLSENYLFYNITSGHVKPALKRSFTLLQLCVLLDVEKNRHVFTQEDLKRLFDSLLDYYGQEKIWMGYHQDYGWVHTIAHSADLFKGLFSLNAFSASKMHSDLEAIRGRFIQGEHAFSHGEDQRSAKALIEGVHSGSISPSSLAAFVEGFERVRTLETVHDGVFPESTVVRRANAAHLLEALFVGLPDKPAYKAYAATIKRLIHSF